MESTKKEKIIKNSNNVVIDISPFETKGQIQEYYRQIHSAIEEKKCIKIKYHSIDKGYSQRILEPHVLIYKTSNWYLYAFCREKNGFRNFKLTRIKELSVLEEHFEEREISDNDFEDIYTELKEVDILLKTNEEYASFLQENFNVISKEEKSKNSKEIYVTLRYPLNSWVYSILLGFGENVEIISPKDIKENILETIKNMKKIYNE